jgi:hypothetical protein
MVDRALQGKIPIKWTKEELDYLLRYKAQAEKFLKYGNNVNNVLLKDWIDPNITKAEALKYEYSAKGSPDAGTGDLGSDTDKKLYEQVAKKFIEYEYTRSGGDLKEFISNWRGMEVGEQSPRSGKWYPKGFMDKPSSQWKDKTGKRIKIAPTYYKGIKKELDKKGPVDSAFNNILNMDDPFGGLLG